MSPLCLCQLGCALAVFALFLTSQVYVTGTCRSLVARLSYLERERTYHV